MHSVLSKADSATVGTATSSVLTAARGVEREADLLTLGRVAQAFRALPLTFGRGGRRSFETASKGKHQRPGRVYLSFTLITGLAKKEHTLAEKALVARVLPTWQCQALYICIYILEVLGSHGLPVNLEARNNQENVLLDPEPLSQFLAVLRKLRLLHVT
eukprot:6492206-Amphidinium_carterae.4